MVKSEPICVEYDYRYRQGIASNVKNQKPTAAAQRSSSMHVYKYAMRCVYGSAASHMHATVHRTMCNRAYH